MSDGVFKPYGDRRPLKGKRAAPKGPSEPVVPPIQAAPKVSAPKAQPPGERVNKFVDDGSIPIPAHEAKDIAAQQKHFKKNRKKYIPKSRRDPIPMIGANCVECGRQDNIYESQLTIRFTDDVPPHSESVYICNKCAAKG
jgi:hypothetical protein